MSDEKRPTTYDELFPGRFLKAGLFKGRDVTLTIKDVLIESLPAEKGGEEDKAILHFRESPKALVLNRTNGESIKAMFGKAVRDWLGKRVTFFPTHDKLGRETVDAIRVRGSPDIAHVVAFELRLPKRKARAVTLAVTSAKPGAPAPAAATSTTTDEPPDDLPPPDVGSDG
ncbi:MAG: hypothetical protein Q8Q14_10895 [Gemmatimonadales bacterium]|nr:hypothetical protein [Gemmatimonadales bacterium]